MFKYQFLILIIQIVINRQLIKEQIKKKADENSTQKKFDKYIEVHLIAHSHDDVGWLKTVDEYYYGHRNDKQLAGVQYTIEGIVTELFLDQEKKFVYVEIGFFYRWYKNQQNKMKEIVKKLVRNGQLEFINGGVCQNDEATPYYEDMIDQMTWGHQFLKREFGIAPNVGWQIDPFGHSSTQASLFHDMGIDGYFFARLDYQDKNHRLDNKNLELIMNPLQDSKKNKPVFTAAFYQYYCSPGGFGYDIGERDDPIMYDSSMEYFNLPQKAQQFIEYFEHMSEFYKTPILLHPMGCDFQYMNAKQNFMNMDRLLKFISEQREYDNISIKYSTVGEYLKKVNNQNITDWETKTDDFLPYGSNPNDYWTGYYTSRPNSKFLIKETGRFLQKSRTMLMNLKLTKRMTDLQYQQFKSLISELELEMGICQHHDAISGTEREEVNQDYSRQLVKARDNLQKFISDLMNTLFQVQHSVDFHFCTWNSTCDVYNKNMSTLLAVYNSYHHSDPQIIFNVNIDSFDYHVQNINNQVQTDYEIICSNHLDTNRCVIYIQTTLLAAQFNFFIITPIKNLNPIRPINVLSDQILQINNYTLTIQQFKFFQIQSNNNHNKKHQFKIDYLYYKSFQDQGDDEHRSGAYSFRPDKSNATAHPYSEFNRAKVYIGNLITIVELFNVNIQMNNNIHCQLKFYIGNKLKQETDFDLFDIVEIESFINSINIEDNQGKEIIMRITNQQIKNKGEFFTDSNGLELQRRQLNYRKTWDLQVSELVAGNYYPVTQMIGIRGEDGQEMFLINDRTQGGSSLRDGELELMLHRRIWGRDDDKGLCETLNERDLDGKGLRSRQKHYLTNSYRTAVKMQYMMDNSPINALAPLNQEITNYKQQSQLILNCISLPAFTKLYLLPDQSFDNQFYLRLQNMDLYDVQVDLSIFNITEMSLTYNMNKQQMEERRLKWNYQSNYPESNSNHKFNENIITLKHFDIKTFLIQQ